MHHSGQVEVACEWSAALQTEQLLNRAEQVERTDPRDFITRIVSNVLQATLVGAVFYKPPNTASGAFAVAGALFFSILYFVVSAQGRAFSGPVASSSLLFCRRFLPSERSQASSTLALSL